MATSDKEIVVSGGAGYAAVAVSESGGAIGDIEAVRARGYWELVWIRFRRDKIAIISGIAIVCLILAAFVGAPVAKHVLGHGPNQIFIGTEAVSATTLQPAGPWTTVHYTDPITAKPKTTLFVLGAANTLGQDEFLRLLYGAQVSLEVALLSTLGVMIIGVMMGSIAGYFRGWSDTIVSRVLAEAGLSFLGLGIHPPQSSWGNLLASAPDYYLAQPWLMLWPGLAVLLTTLAFNLLGDGLRDSFDPRAAQH